MDFEKKDIFILIPNHWIFWVLILIDFSFFSIYNIARREIYIYIYICSKYTLITKGEFILAIKKNSTQFKLLLSYKNSFLLP